MSFAANLGMLFTDLPLPDAVRAAAEAGFGAVECHYPYATDPGALRAALDETGLALLSINAAPGDPQVGEFGLAAVPGRGGDARLATEQAVAYAAAVGARRVHVLAGRTDGGRDAWQTYARALDHACDVAGTAGLGILIEPINRRDVPRYHLSTVEAAAEVISDLAHPNLWILYDCYHVQTGQGDVTRRFEAHAALVGAVQIAAVPDRGEPDRGEIDYGYVIGAIRRSGFAGPISGEYRPRGISTAAGLDWLSQLG